MTDALVSFLAMGGYASFVWPAYAIALAALGWMLIDSVGAYRRRQRELSALERERAPR
jgi:heme exporter protein D